MRSKKQLAVTLSRLQQFDRPRLILEQYPTDSEIAADIVWHAHLAGDIEGKTIADLGCGTGILGIGCLLMGAEKVYFVDVDKPSIKRLKENLALFDLDNYDIACMDIKDFAQGVDVVVQNPPFGTKKEHADRKFLKKAFTLSPVIYSFHKYSTKDFVDAIARDNSYSVTNLFRYDFPLKNTHKHHTKHIERIDVGCWRMEKKAKS